MKVHQLLAMNAMVYGFDSRTRYQ